MKISSSSSSSFHHSFSKPPKNNHVDHDQLLANKKKPQFSRLHRCYCGKEFSSGNALGGHKASHRLHRLPPKKRISKALALLSLEQSSKHDVFKIPAYDLTRYLPPKNYNTKKRWRKGINKYLQVVTAVSHSHEVYNGSFVDPGVDRRAEKRPKLSSNVDEIDNILQSPKLGAEQKIDEGEKDNDSTRELGSTSYARDFDLNEIPSDDVANETI